MIVITEDSTQNITFRTADGVSIPATLEITNATPEEIDLMNVCFKAVFYGDPS